MDKVNEWWLYKAKKSQKLRAYLVTYDEEPYQIHGFHLAKHCDGKTGLGQQFHLVRGQFVVKVTPKELGQWKE